jgi:Bacterial regulatory proteins, luxR family
VLTWVAQGKTNADVAKILGISCRTVDTLLSRTYQKLGVENRTAAVMRMIRFIKLSAIFFGAVFWSRVFSFELFLHCLNYRSFNQTDILIPMIAPKT